MLWICHCEKSLILKQSITQSSSFRHIERKRNISNKSCMRFFGLRPLNDAPFRHIERKRNISNKSCMRFFAYGSEWRKSCQCWLFYIGVCATPSPAPNILSFLLRRKKKEYWIRKKNNADSKQSLNSTQNSWTRYRSDNTSFILVSLSDCRLSVISAS